jgi:hypothetical protein
VHSADACGEERAPALKKGRTKIVLVLLARCVMQLDLSGYSIVTARAPLEALVL